MKRLRSVALILSLLASLPAAFPALGKDNEGGKVYFKADAGLLTANPGATPAQGFTGSASAEYAVPLADQTIDSSGRMTFIGLAVEGELPRGEDSGRKPRLKVEAANAGLLRLIPTFIALGVSGPDNLAPVGLMMTGEIKSGGTTLKLKDSLYIETTPRLGREIAIGGEWEAVIRKDRLVKIAPGVYMIGIYGGGLKAGLVHRKDGPAAELVVSATVGAGLCALIDSAEDHKLCLEGKLKTLVGFTQAGSTGETGVYYTGVADKDENGNASVLFTASATASGDIETSSAGTYMDLRPANLNVGVAF